MWRRRAGVRGAVVEARLSGPGGPAPRTASGRAREEWTDVLKGVTILLVVLHHACLGLAGAGVDLGWWVPFDQTLIWIRMPLFFLLSGLFAARVVSGPGVALWRDRTGRFVYLFCLWSVIHLLFYLIVAWVVGWDVRAELATRAWALSIGLSPMWFIMALAGFFAIARVVRAFPVWTQLVAAVLLSVAVFVFDVRYPFDKIWLFAFFLFGCHYSRSIRRFATWVQADRIAGWRVLRPLRFFGGRTLPVCVLHGLVLSILPWTAFLAWFGSATPVIETAISAGGALAVWWMLRRFAWLFDLPARWKEASV